MIRWSLVLLLGCNQVLGVHRTHPPDGEGIDAPFACPPIGTTPHFAKGFHQVAVGECEGYMTNGVRAVATCYARIAEGPADQPLLPAQGVPPSDTDAWEPRLTPEGDEMLVHARIPFKTFTYLAFYARGAGDMWTLEYNPSITVTADDQLGTLTRGANGRRLVILQNSDGQAHEYICDGGTGWSPGPVHTLSELGVESMMRPALTSDGLRMVFQGVATASMTTAVLYTDRPDLAHPFRTAEPLEGVPLIPDPFLTDDCARLYYSAGDIEAVFYSQQR